MKTITMAERLIPESGDKGIISTKEINIKTWELPAATHARSNGLHGVIHIETIVWIYKKPLILSVISPHEQNGSSRCSSSPTKRWWGLPIRGVPKSASNKHERPGGAAFCMNVSRRVLNPATFGLLMSTRGTLWKSRVESPHFLVRQEEGLDLGITCSGN